MRPPLVLLPSPLLGPAVWAPVAHVLEVQGWTTIVPTVDPAAISGEEVAQSFLSALPDDREVILVPHSNAGLFVPALSSRLETVGHVFVDAGLPPPEGSVPLAPESFYEFLDSRADDHGMLPPWTQWWGEDEAASLFPDDEVRRHVGGEARRLPLSYFRGSMPVPGGWSGVPSAYLAFGDGYAEERDRASGLGWPVRTLTGPHLHLLFEPAEVANTISSLLASLGLHG